jgi:hypothetical protein
MNGPNDQRTRPDPSARQGLPIEARLLLVSMSLVGVAVLAALELSSF